MRSPETFVFGEFRLSADRRELLVRGVPARLGSRAIDLLLALARRPGQLATKDELIAEVWPDTVVEDNNLKVQISAIRKVLREETESSSWLLTVPGRGYRFVAPVECRVPAATSGATSFAQGTVVSLPLPDRPSIAVLPFADMSGDPDQEYFANGISEDLITGLSRIRWLFVIARNSAFVYKGRAVDVKQVSRELGVRYVLEGSVRRSGNRLRIGAQLVDATTGGHHWAERYDRELGDIFAVQDDIFWRLTHEDCATAVEPLKRAVEAYPDYAPARGLLGFCWVFAAHMGWIDREPSLRNGRQQAIRAIALDDRHPWGHIALAYAAMMERRTEESIASFRRAVGLNPNSAAAHSHLSRGLAFAGRDREAIEHGEEAIRLSPLDPEMAMFLGAIAVAHYTAGRYAETIERSLEAQRLRPGFQGSRRLLCASLAQAGRVDEARSLLATIRCEQPQLSLAWSEANVPFQKPELMDRYLEGFRKAGLDDG